MKAVLHKDDEAVKDLLEKLPGIIAKWPGPIRIEYSAGIKDVTKPGDQWRRRESLGLCRIVIERDDQEGREGLEYHG